MSAKVLTVYDYQRLIERGWRRSGSWLYKPNLKTTCCKLYTIRLKVAAFTMSKEQRRVLRRFERYLAGEDVQQPGAGAGAPEGEGHMLVDEASPRGPPSGSLTKDDSDARKSDAFAAHIARAIAAALGDLIARGALPSPPAGAAPPPPVASFVARDVAAKQKLAEDVLYASPAAPQYAGWTKKHGQGGTAEVGSLQALLVGELNKERGRLPGGVRASVGGRGFVNFHVTDPNLRADLLALHAPCPGIPRGQGQPSTSRAPPAPTPRRPPRTFEVATRRAAFDPEEFALYKKYQVAVHGDPPSKINERGYTNFLVESPMPPVAKAEDEAAPPCGYGAFHQQYRIDGRLVAVGVVDVLPHCLSSKYCFYDPDLSFLALGKLVSLKEIEWVQAQRAVAGPQFDAYFMGFYIHTCPKMRYKGEYRPSELLCPEAYTWWPLAAALPFVSDGGYCCLSRAVSGSGRGAGAPDEVDPETGPGDVPMAEVLRTRILCPAVGRAVVPLGGVLAAFLEEAQRGVVEEVRAWRRAVGRELADQMVYLMS